MVHVSRLPSALTLLIRDTVLGLRTYSAVSLAVEVVVTLLAITLALQRLLQSTILAPMVLTY